MPTITLPYFWSQAPPDQPPDAAFTSKHTLWWPVIDCGVSHVGTGQYVPFSLLLDSGASYSIFRADIAYTIGLSVRHGAFKSLPGLGGGRLDAWFHHVGLELRDRHSTIRLTSYVGFIEDGLSEDNDDEFLGILGQHSFLDKTSDGEWSVEIFGKSPGHYTSTAKHDNPEDALDEAIREMSAHLVTCPLCRS